jgi:DNA polymerase III epsilon subunit-like protein
MVPITKLLIFDVETTGLLPKAGSGDPSPHIIQFSFILYNVEDNIIEEIHNYYIQVGSDVVISPKITELTGITRDMCDRQGIHIVDALLHFSRAYDQATMVIAHNHSFDSAMVKIEVERNRDHPRANFINMFQPDGPSKIQFCTMRSSVNICNIMVEKPGQKPYKKWPTLLELYRHQFASTPDNLHNSIVDVLVCMRCFLKLYYDRDMGDAAFGQLVATCITV